MKKKTKKQNGVISEKEFKEKKKRVNEALGKNYKEYKKQHL